MKKILDPGKDVFKITCKRCLCKFEYTLDELKRRGMTEHITCPWCEAEMLHQPESGR